MRLQYHRLVRSDESSRSKSSFDKLRMISRSTILTLSPTSTLTLSPTSTLTLSPTSTLSLLPTSILSLLPTSTLSLLPTSILSLSKDAAATPKKQHLVSHHSDISALLSPG